MSTNRFHKAAKDGMLDVIKEATRSDCNSRDEQRMTPTLFAAFHGNLDALRLLCGRGGDPDKADLFGNTALHLAAAQGHKQIVTFLVNFGVNPFCTDIDGRTAQELAAMNNKEDILRFLDGVSAKIEAGDKKKAKTMKEKALKMSKKSVKKFNKNQTKKEDEDKKFEQKGLKGFNMETLRSRMKSGSMSNLSHVDSLPPRTSFSAIVSGNNTLSYGKKLSTIQRKVLSKNNRLANIEDDFKISEIEDGKRTISSLKGYRRDSEILYSGTLESTKRGKLDGVFNEAEHLDMRNEDTPPPSNGMSRSRSQPDFLQQLREENVVKETHEAPASIFVRPGIGSIAFRKNITNNFSGFSGPELATTEESSIGSGDSNFGQRNNLLNMDDELSDIESSDEDENSSGPLERFLTAWGLGEYLSKFEDQKIDLETLMLLTENDLNSLNLPLGPYRKLVTAVNERKSALENPGEVVDSML